MATHGSPSLDSLKNSEGNSGYRLDTNITRGEDMENINTLENNHYAKPEHAEFTATDENLEKAIDIMTKTPEVTSVMMKLYRELVRYDDFEKSVAINRPAMLGFVEEIAMAKLPPKKEPFDGNEVITEASEKWIVPNYQEHLKDAVRHIVKRTCCRK